MRAFACKLRPTVHVQIIYSVRGKPGSCNILLDNRCVSGCRFSGKITKCKYDYGCVLHPVLTDNQYVPALSVHVDPACRYVSREHRLWNFEG